MILEDAVKTLRLHNEWRRYDGEPENSPEMVSPQELGTAIDVVCDTFEKVSGWIDTCKEALAVFGRTPQIDKAVEECAELSDALMKFKYGRCARRDVITEIADVKIMCQQMAILMGEKEVQKEIEYKLSRLKGRIEEHDSTV